MHRAASFLALFIASSSFAAPPVRPEIALGSDTLDGVSSFDVAATSNGVDGFAVWRDQRSPNPGIFATRIDRDGVPDPYGIRLTSDIGYPNPSIAWAGDSYVIAFVSSESRNGVCCKTGTMVLNRDGSTRRERVDMAIARSVAVAANTQRTLVVVGAAQSYIAFLQPDGTPTKVTDLQKVVASSAIIARDDGFTIYTVESTNGTAYTLHRIRITNSGTVDDQLLFGECTSTFDVAAAPNGSQDLLVWSRTDLQLGTPKQIYVVSTAFAIVPASGQIVRGATELQHFEIPYTTPNQPYEATRIPPSIGFDGHQFAITYAQYDGSNTTVLRMTRIAADGTVVPGSQSELDRSRNDPASSKLHATFFATASKNVMVWARYSRTSERGEARTRVVAFNDFASLDPSVSRPLAASKRSHAFPATAAGDGSFGVVWVESGIQGVAAAQIVSSRGIATPPVTLSDGTWNAMVPSIANGGGIYLAVWLEADWSEEAASRVHYRIAMRRIANDGTPLGNGVTFLQSDLYATISFYLVRSLDRVSVAWTGSHFVVAWRGGDNTIRVQRISADGQLLDKEPVAAYFNYLDLYNPKLVVAGSDTLVIFYARVSADWGIPMAVVGVRIGSGGEIGPPVTFVAATTVVDRTWIPLEAAWNGKTLAIAWQQPAPDGGQSYWVVGRRFALDGTPNGDIRILNAEPSGYGQLIPNGTSWWYLRPSPESEPTAQRLDESLSPTAETLPVAPWGMSPRGGSGVLVDGKLVVAYTRLDEPDALVERTYLQTIFTRGRDRAVQH